MARITVRTPVSKPLRIVKENVATTFEVLAEAPDFSVPDSSESLSFRDPTDSARGIRPGEVFFLSPIAAKNKTASTVIVEVQYAAESGETISFGELEIPGNDTGFVPIQGRQLLKQDLAGTTGDQIQIKASVENAVDVWVSAEEKAAADHIGAIE